MIWFEGSDLEATAYAIADNRTHEFSQWDEPALARLLQELRAEDALDAVGYTDLEIDDLLAELAAEDGSAELALGAATGSSVPANDLLWRQARDRGQSAGQRRAGPNPIGREVWVESQFGSC